MGHHKPSFVCGEGRRPRECSVVRLRRIVIIYLSVAVWTPREAGTLATHAAGKFNYIWG